MKLSSLFFIILSVLNSFCSFTANASSDRLVEVCSDFIGSSVYTRCGTGFFANQIPEDKTENIMLFTSNHVGGGKNLTVNGESVRVVQKVDDIERDLTILTISRKASHLEFATLTSDGHLEVSADFEDKDGSVLMNWGAVHCRLPTLKKFRLNSTKLVTQRVFGSILTMDETDLSLDLTGNIVTYTNLLPGVSGSPLVCLVGRNWWIVAMAKATANYSRMSTFSPIGLNVKDLNRAQNSESQVTPFRWEITDVNSLPGRRFEAGFLKLLPNLECTEAQSGTSMLQGKEGSDSGNDGRSRSNGIDLGLRCRDSRDGQYDPIIGFQLKRVDIPSFISDPLGSILSNSLPKDSIVYANSSSINFIRLLESYKALVSVRPILLRQPELLKSFELRFGPKPQQFILGDGSTLTIDSDRSTLTLSFSEMQLGDSRLCQPDKLVVKLADVSEFDGIISLGGKCGKSQAQFTADIRELFYTDTSMNQIPGYFNTHTGQIIPNLLAADFIRQAFEPKIRIREASSKQEFIIYFYKP